MVNGNLSTPPRLCVGVGDPTRSNHLFHHHQFAALVTLRDALTPLSSALMMRLDLPSYWRPKDQSLQVPQLKDEYPELTQLFYEVHSVKNIPSRWLRTSLEELASLMKKYDWDQEETIENFLECVSDLGWVLVPDPENYLLDDGEIDWEEQLEAETELAKILFS